MENITDIFYLNNGQLNWAAIGTIINSVLVLTLVCITWWYASKVNEQTNMLSMEHKQKLVLDEIQQFLTPCSKDLEKENKLLKDNEFEWYQREDKSKSKFTYIIKISNKEFGEGFAKNDVIKKYPSLKNLCFEHDQTYDKLIEVYDEIKNALEKIVQRDCLKNLMEQFNKNQESTYKIKDDEIKNPVQHFIKYFVNYEYYKKNYTNDDCKVKFLKECEEAILKCIESMELKKLYGDRQTKLIQLIEIDEAILKEIKQIIINYRQEYNITENEINPQRYKNIIY